MTVKQFRIKIMKLIEESGQFITYDNTDPSFDYKEDEFCVCGDDKNETFALKIYKVRED